MKRILEIFDFVADPKVEKSSSIAGNIVQILEDWSRLEIIEDQIERVDLCGVKTSKIMKNRRRKWCTVNREFCKDGEVIR